MLIYTNSDLFTSPAQTLVNTVNLKGVMGKGIAKDFKILYPQMYKKYRFLCANHQFRLGQLQLFKGEPALQHGLSTGSTRQRWVLNFPTKIDWRQPSKLSYLQDSLRAFVQTYQQKGIESVAFPMLGAGCGHLSWSKVKPLMESYLESLDIPVYIHIYKPVGAQRTDQRLIETNLNTPHDSFKQMQSSPLLRDDLINGDGVVLPGAKIYQQQPTLLHVDALPVSGMQRPELLRLNAQSIIVSDSH